MSTVLVDSTATETLHRDELATLIATAQDVPVTVWFDADGEERMTHHNTPASEAALERLSTAFLPLMRKVVRAHARRMDVDDAFGIVMGEFVAAVRRHDLEGPRSFRADIETILSRAVSDVARSQRGIVTVPESTAARFYQLLAKHDGDIQDAYRECCTSSNGFEPATFLAVHSALVSSDDSLDSPSRLYGEDGTSGGESMGSVADAAALTTPDSSDDVVTAELIRWLFSLSTERQERILRLIFGFQDFATETLRSEYGFRPGECLSDREVSGVIGGGTSTISRQKREALATMRAALVSAMADEVAA